MKICIAMDNVSFWHLIGLWARSVVLNGVEVRIFFAIACLSCINDFVLTGVDIANMLSIFSVQSKFVTS